MERANKDQYELLFGIVYKYLLEKRGIEVNKKNLDQIHNEFKEYLGYDSIAGISMGSMARFVWEVKATAAIEKGDYIPEKGEPSNAEILPLEILWKK
jgi:hypothetical protein